MNMYSSHHTDNCVGEKIDKRIYASIVLTDSFRWTHICIHRTQKVNRVTAQHFVYRKRE